MSYDKHQLAYCSNVHSGETLAEVKHNITHLIAQVGQQRQVDSMASGLWLSAIAASTLQDNGELEGFKQCLAQANIRLTSINGFPYGDFHQTKVKAQVYLPDWADIKRLEYSKNLARVLAACLPDDCDFGAISTLPLGYKAHWNEHKQQLADEHFRQLAMFLAELKQQTGKHIVIAIEMEPDCVLESTHQLIDYFVNTLQGFAGCFEHLQICYDVCHQAVMYENGYDSLRQITSAGIAIGKIQLSNALVANFFVDNLAENNLTQDSQALLALLADFCEPKYLHQVKSQDANGLLIASPDLADALNADRELLSTNLLTVNLSATREWRIHFHVPVHAEFLSHPQLQTTRDALLQVFDFLAEFEQVRPWLEVETYSWNVLPEGLRPVDENSLLCSIVAELDWVEQQLQQRGLLLDE